MASDVRAEITQLASTGCLFNNTDSKSSTKKSWNDCFQCLFAHFPANLQMDSWPKDLLYWWTQRPGKNFIVGKGMYAAQLAWWMSLFDPSQFLIVNSDDLIQAPYETVARLLKFLGVEPWTQDQFNAVSESSDSFHLQKDMHELARHQVLLDELYSFFKPHNEQLYELLRMIGVKNFTPFAGSYKELEASEKRAASKLKAVPMHLGKETVLVHV